MERRLLYCILLLASCGRIPETDVHCTGPVPDGTNASPTEVVICPGGYTTRSSAPDEMQLTDFNIFIFNADGLLEEHVYADISQMHSNDDGDWTYGFHLLAGCTYSIYVCANTGFRLPCRTLEEVLDYRFYMAYPDEYRMGMLMSGVRYLDFQGEEEIVDEYGNATGSYVPIYSELKSAMLCVSPNQGSSDVQQFGTLEDYDRTMTTSDAACEIDENSVLWIDGIWLHARPGIH